MPLKPIFLSGRLASLPRRLQEQSASSEDGIESVLSDFDDDTGKLIDWAKLGSLLYVCISKSWSQEFSSSQIINDHPLTLWLFIILTEQAYLKFPWTLQKHFTIKVSNPSFLYGCVCVCVCVLVAQSCLTFCNPMDCSSPGSSVHGILQARILQWDATPFSRGSSWVRDWIQVSCIAGRFFTVWAIREAPLLDEYLHLKPVSIYRFH